MSWKELHEKSPMTVIPAFTLIRLTTIYPMRVACASMPFACIFEMLT
jgi:hypothetical protein